MNLTLTEKTSDIVSYYLAIKRGDRVFDCSKHSRGVVTNVHTYLRVFFVKTVFFCHFSVMVVNQGSVSSRCWLDLIFQKLWGKNYMWKTISVSAPSHHQRTFFFLLNRIFLHQLTSDTWLARIGRPPLNHSNRGNQFDTEEKKT